MAAGRVTSAPTGPAHEGAPAAEARAELGGVRAAASFAASWAPLTCRVDGALRQGSFELR